MSKPRRDKASFPLEDTLFAIKQRKAVPHEFVLDAIAPLSPETRSMFGCLAVYVQDKIVLILRDKRDGTADNGVWLATTEEHHQSLRREFPNMRSIQVFGKKVTGWQVLPADAKDFEGPRCASANLPSQEILESGTYLDHGAPRDRGPIRQQGARSGRSHQRRPGTRVRRRESLYLLIGNGSNAGAPNPASCLRALRPAWNG